MIQTGGWYPWELAYCSNVHPGEGPDGILATIQRHIAAVRVYRGLETLATGLWLPAGVARELASNASLLTRFRETLAQNGIVLYTVNGFPYGGFHAQRVKETVYTPDWADPRRSAYTLDIATALAQLSPETLAEATISTVPLGFASEWSPEKHQLAARALARLAASLQSLQHRTGKHVRLCLEMEPGCVLETTAQTVNFFVNDLPAAARAEGVADDTLKKHLGVCYDICHQAVMFENPAESLQALINANITVGKIQVSSAVQVPNPADLSARNALAEFAEPRYLHQVRSERSTSTCLDLPDALAGQLPGNEAWRIHFHVPIHALNTLAGLATTQAEIGKVLDFAAAHPNWRPQLEVETYTWQVLPPNLRPSNDAELAQGLGRELAWLSAQLEQRNLLNTQP